MALQRCVETGCCSENIQKSHISPESIYTGCLSNTFSTSAVKIVYLSWTSYLNSSAEASSARQSGENSLRTDGECFCEAGDS